MNSTTVDRVVEVYFEILNRAVTISYLQYMAKQVYLFKTVYLKKKKKSHQSNSSVPTVDE